METFAARPEEMRSTRLLHDLFAAAVREHGERVAVEVPSSDGSSRSTLTYRELDAAAVRIQSALQEVVVDECVVAILLPRDNPLLLAAQIAVLRAGAAWVCPDVGFPDSHVRFVLEDSKAIAVLTDVAGIERIGGDDTMDVDALVAEPAPCTTPEPAPWLAAESLAYVIYTSGTSGKPKGVLIEHAGVVDLIEQGPAYFGIRPEDRIAQNASHAYDASVEEVWFTFHAAATLVVMDDETARSGPDLLAWLRRERITMLMPTPTMLLSTGAQRPKDELPDLRIVYVGGEPIAQDLCDRWSDGIWLENGYGPTECTITATRVRLHRGEPVTIGRAIPGRTAHVLDADLQPVSPGDSGELCIAGKGVARGYLERPELTARQFPIHPDLGRIYRTGDLVREDVDGLLHYLGRIDTQVKIRGYRIELEAIEAELGGLPDVQTAACAVQGPKGREEIVAFLVPTATTPATEAEWFASVAQRLGAVVPDYMVPARFAAIEQLPTTVGGKLARKALPELDRVEPIRERPMRAPRDTIEARIAVLFGLVLDLEEVSIDDDFFDLGGTSLRAAELVSLLRQQGDLAALTVRDVYEERTVEGLAGRSRAGAAHAATPAEDERMERPRGGKPIAATLAQGAFLLGGLVVAAPVVWLGLYFVLPFLVAEFELTTLILASPVVGWLMLLLYTPISIGAAVVAKRLLIGRYTATRQPVWGSFYVRNWMVQRLVQLIPWRFLGGTVWQATALRALGARVGERVHIHRDVNLFAGGWDLLTIGDDVTLSQGASVGLVHLEDGEVVVGPVELRDGCTLEVRAGVTNDTVVGERSVLTALSALPSGARVGADQVWDGIPAEHIGASSAPPDVDGSRELSPVAFSVRLLVMNFSIGLLLSVPVIALSVAAVELAAVPGGELLAWLFAPRTSAAAFGLVVAILAAHVVGTLVLRAVVLRVLPSVPDGTISRFDPRYILVWVRAGLLVRAGGWLAGSLFWPVWLRVAGMRIGRNSEVSTIIDVLPENVTIAEECFFADGIYLAGPRVHRGTVTTRHTRFGKNTFLGNHVVIPAGAALPEDILLGVCTVADDQTIRPGSSWFGHPPFELPRREVVTVDRSLTHEPTPLLFVNRVFWELLRFVLPAIAAVAALLWFDLLGTFSVLPTSAFVLFGIPAATIAVGLGVVGLVLALKWLLLGRVKPGQHGLWSGWCCRWDFFYMVWGRLAARPLSQLGGSLLLTPYLRLMGVRIGKRVVLGDGFAHVVDPDMLHFADDATYEGQFQAHSFEDRVLKIGHVHIGERSSVRRNAVLMYGAQIGAGARVAPHSVVMKHESLLPRRDYAGCPTRPMSG